MHIDLGTTVDDSTSNASDERNKLKYKSVGGSSSIGMDPVQFISIQYHHDDSFMRFLPRLSLRDIDESMFLPILNKSLAEKVKAIHIYANGFKLQEIVKTAFSVDMTPFVPDIPVAFTDDELADMWVRIRPTDGTSAFWMAFFEQTPKRMFSASQTPNNLVRGVRSDTSNTNEA